MKTNHIYFVESHIPAFSEFDIWKDKKILEFGYGIGIGTDAVNFSKNGAYYTLVELTNNSLDITKNRFGLFNLNGKFHNFLDSKEIGNEFDLIYSFCIIIDQKIIDNSFIALKTGGILKLMIYDKNLYHPSNYQYTNVQLYDMFKKYRNINIKYLPNFSKYKNYQYKINENIHINILEKKLSWYLCITCEK